MYCLIICMLWHFDVSDDIFAMFVKRIKVQVLQLQVGSVMPFFMLCVCVCVCVCMFVCVCVHVVSVSVC